MHRRWAPPCWPSPRVCEGVQGGRECGVPLACTGGCAVVELQRTLPLIITLCVLHLTTQHPTIPLLPTPPTWQTACSALGLLFPHVLRPARQLPQVSRAARSCACCVAYFRAATPHALAGLQAATHMHPKQTSSRLGCCSISGVCPWAGTGGARWSGSGRRSSRSGSLRRMAVSGSRGRLQHHGPRRVAACSITHLC